MVEPIQILVVDDERPARDKMLRLLSEYWPEAELRQAVDGAQALQFLEQQRADVIFLDIQMPEMDGLQVASHLRAPVPDIVFVTAFDQYAVQAFDANAIDYLLKPYDEARFLKALEKLRVRRGTASSSSPAVDAPLMISDRGMVYVLQIAEIVWAEAADNYVMIYTSDKHYMLRQTLSGLLDRLGPAFMRCHRRFLVCVDKISHIETLSKGDAQLHLKNGAAVPCSRQYREELLDKLEQQ
ncbi:LytTR family DNA-binding domain-containing protein [Undibacterium cyanobacteriorum]|uniref:LytTR family DNA-binding domain-containing protein n=1 Tax=Undibacterium cyanobacteriorum TaxID=3073561 RepID=A0ABY9RL76_9BURK|nr:LytTR family DNA-binding domain-containing protein [Undibacterium sp. 20NA77.5]WMW81117.1 LytTR family DNA-binding domain-containing protein [Undibacterium sp. 20NA77.5]